MRVEYFSKTSEIGPSSRYRIYQFLPFLDAGGVSVTVRPLFGSLYFRVLTWRPSILRWIVTCLYVVVRFARRGFDLLLSHGADLILLEGQLFPYLPPLVERILAGRRRVVIEFDDAIYLTAGHARKIPILLSLSVGAIVGNQTLAAYAAAHSPNVQVIPTVVDTDRFTPGKSVAQIAEGTTDHPITIGWIGLAYNASYLEWLTPVFLKLQQEHNVHILVICSQPPRLEGINMTFRAWSHETEVEDLRTCQIGVMPLPDNEWAEGKCGLKLLQYMAVGLAAVASPRGVNREIISDGVNGFLAETHEQWYAQLSHLCGDKLLRIRMGQAARKTVESRYSLSVWGPRLPDLYKRFLSVEGPKKPTEQNRAARTLSASPPCPRY